MNWVSRKIHLYNVTVGLYMLDWWERCLFNVLIAVLLWFVCYNTWRSATDFFSSHVRRQSSWSPIPFAGHMEDVQRQVNEAVQSRHKIDKMYAAFTGQPLEKVQQYTERDRFFSSSSEALEFVGTGN